MMDKIRWIMWKTETTSLFGHAVLSVTGNLVANQKNYAHQINNYMETVVVHCTHSTPGTPGSSSIPQYPWYP